MGHHRHSARIAAALCAVLACSRERPPLEPAVGISPMPPGRTIGKSDRLASEIEHLDESADDWPTEAFSRAATKELEALASALHDPAAPFAAHLANGFSCSALHCADCRTVYSDSGIQVFRGEIGPKSFEGQPGLLDQLRGLSAAHGAGADIHAKFEIVRVDASDDEHFETRILGQIWSEKVQQDCEWTARWDWPDRKSPPLLRLLDATRCEEKRALKPLFSDCTAAVIGATSAWKEQLLRGTDDWCARIDIASGMNQYAHNGIAIGDVDGDGLEDLYVCQSGGLPNRLFKHQSDGTAVDISASAGVDWLNDSASALIVDLDNDGHQDLAITTDRFLLVMRGDGAGKFELKTELPFTGGYSLAAADYDNDRLLDLYVCRYNTSETSGGLPAPYHDANNGPPNALLRNSGDFKFVEVTKDVGLDANNRKFSFAASWVDYDEDGDLDLYVSNDFGRKNLYRNDGGKFKDVAVEAGVDDCSAGMGASFADFDGDGHLDLYGSNMFTAAGQRVANLPRFKSTVPAKTRAEYQRHCRGNALFRNKNDGTFEDVTIESGTAMGRWAWCGQFCDFNNDGREDLYVPNGFFTNEDPRDLASYFWRRVTSQSPLNGALTAPYADAWGVTNRMIREGWSWAGREPNTAYLNLGDGTFADISFVSGLGFADDGRCFASVDWDADGDCDLWLANRTAPRVRFVRNDTEGAWIEFHLTGKDVNRDAIGARVDVTSGGKKLVRILQAGSGYLSQSSKWLCFGVGSSKKIDEVRVRWPDGSTTSAVDLSTNRRYTITQGGLPTAIAPAAPISLAPSIPVPITPTEIARIPLAVRPPVPSMSFVDFEKKTHALGADQRPTLVAFWSSTCPSCIHQLDAWSRAENEITAAGVSIVALSVDQPATKSAIEPLEPWFPAGAAPDEWLATFEILQRSLLDRHRPLPLPCSFLIDATHSLAYIYKGPLTVETLIQDAGRLKLQGNEFSLVNAPFPGRWYRGPGNPRLFEMAGMFHDRGLTDTAMFYLEVARKIIGDPGNGGLAQRQLSDSQLRAGVALLDQKRYDDAERILRQAIAYNENDALAWYALGQCFYGREKMADAQKCYERAVALDPELATAWNVLGAVKFAQNDVAGALEAYQHAVESDPTMSEAWFALGVYYITAQKFAEGIQSFRKVVALQPQMSMGWTGLGNCLLMTGDKPAGIAALQKALDLDPSNARAKGMLEEAGAPPR